MPVLPDDVRRFVLTSIPSVPYLEAALLLRASPGKRYTLAELAAALYLPEREGAQLAQALQDRGLAQMEGEPAAIMYAPQAPGLSEAMDALAAAYAADLVAVTHLIHDSTQKHAQRFADAFKLRKDR